MFAAKSSDEAAGQSVPSTRNSTGRNSISSSANTFTTFWAVHATHAADRPALLYVHESSTPALFYRDRLHPSLIALAESAFSLADCVSFTTAATRRYHADAGRSERHRLTSCWIDVARIDAWLRKNPRAGFRKRPDVRQDEFLVSNIGTASDRKGQHIFERAVELFCRRYPELGQCTQFLMLGGRETEFDRLLRELEGIFNRPKLIVHQETPDYLPYYRAADLFVCSSYEESSPRVVLEAMVCGTPILSSGVHGVPELVSAELEEGLVPPGDPSALCEAMAKLLLSPAIGRTLAARARTRVENHFNAAILLPRHLALPAEVTAGCIT